MRLTCANCEAPFITNFVNAERFPTALCRMCRHEESVALKEIPVPRLFGRELDMGRWFGGLIPRYNEQGRHTVDRTRR